MYLSPCGITCESFCDYKASCGGNCHAGGGKPFYLKDFGVDVCPIYDCAVNKKGYHTCGECEELPCSILYGWRDPSSTEEEHNRSIKDRTTLFKALRKSENE